MVNAVVRWPEFLGRRLARCEPEALADELGIAVTTLNLTPMVWAMYSPVDRAFAMSDALAPEDREVAHLIAVAHHLIAEIGGHSKQIYIHGRYFEPLFEVPFKDALMAFVGEFQYTHTPRWSIRLEGREDSA